MTLYRHYLEYGLGVRFVIREGNDKGLELEVLFGPYTLSVMR